MKKINLIVTLSILLCAFVSCDKIEGPYITPDDSVDTDVEFPDLDPSTVFRKVLVEEYTGTRCVNCPDGHRELEALHNRYGDTLVAIGIHAGTFAMPMGAFTTDFRTEEGNALYQDYAVAQIGTPAAVVNRSPYNNTFALNISSWQPAIEQEKSKACVAAVQLYIVLNPVDKTITTHTKTTPLNGYEGNMQLALYLIEDGIIAPQKDGEETIDDYVHNHVLRASFNGVYGTQLTTPEEDGTYLKSYQIDYSQKSWNISNCSIVAVLMDADTREVLQVEQEKFIP